MSVATVAIEITCPDWCDTDLAEHGSDLWELGGSCLHRMPFGVVEDTEGYQVPLSAPIYHAPVEVRLVSHARPDGREDASPVIYINDREYSVQQALALIDEITRQVELYRSTGGAA